MNRNKPRWEYNIKTDLKWDDMDWIRLSQVIGKWWVVVHRAKYLSRQQNLGIGGRTMLNLF